MVNVIEKHRHLGAWVGVIHLLLCVCVGWQASAAAEDALELSVRMEEVAGVDRTQWPVRGGIPFPQGRLIAGAENKLQLLDTGGHVVPMIPTVAAKWPDGSTKWLRIDAQADFKANDKNQFTLKTGATVGPKHPLKVDDAADAISVDTGVLQFSVLKTLPGGLGKITAHGKVYSEKGIPDAMVVDYQTRGPTLNSLANRGHYKRNEVPSTPTTRLLASTGKDYKAAVEISTPLRVVIRTEGWYGAEGKRPACKYVVRYTAYAGKAQIKIHHTIILTEDPMKFFVRRIGFRLPFGKANSFQVGGADKSVSSENHILAAGQSAALLSIGPVIHHNGLNIADGPKKDVAFEVFTYSGDGNDVTKRNVVAHGKHALGYMTVLGEGKGCTLALRNFWEQHPNELSYQAKDGLLTCWMWADHGGKIIDMRNPKYDMKIRGEHRIGGKAAGTAKTHELLLNFHSDKDAEVAAQTALMQEYPIWPFVTPEWNCATDAIPLTHPRDTSSFPGLEKQIDLLYAWVQKNQKQMHWDGFFGYGGVLIEFDNHRQRHSGGPKNTWCCLDYAGFLNEDGQQSHHFFTHYYRSGRRAYMEMGEAYLRRIADTICVHYENSEVKVSHKPPANNKLGAGHRHDMTAWHAFCSGYSMATFGSVDFYYLTGDERIRENMEIYAYRCEADGLGSFYGGSHFTYSLARIYEATGNVKWKTAYEKRLADKKITDLLEFFVTKGSFRSPSDLYPHMIMFEQMLDHKPTAEKLMLGADTRTKVMSEELFAWAYHRTKDKKYLEKVKTRVKFLGKNLESIRKISDPWKMTWQELRKSINLLPVWYAKVYINSQTVGRYPSIMATLSDAGLTEMSAIDPLKALPYLGPLSELGLIRAGDPCSIKGIVFLPKDATKALKANLFYRAKGEKAMKSVPLVKGDKNKYSAEIPADATKGPFEFYIEVAEEGQKILRQPSKGIEAPILVQPDVNPPSGVSNFKTTQNKDYVVALAWDVAKDDLGIKGYRIYKGSSAGFKVTNENLLKEVDSKQTAFEDKKPTSGKTTFYAVTAVDIAGRTGETIYLEVAVPENQAPGNALKLTVAAGSRSLVLKWDGVLEPDVVELEIFRAKGVDGKFELLHTLNPNTTKQFLDKALESGETYRYQFKLIDRAGLVSPLSKPVAQGVLGFVRRINCGGVVVESSDGVAWEADRQRRPGMGLYRTKATITGVSKALQGVYQSERWANSEISYGFKVPAGTYRVIFHFAETNQNFAATGKRVFDININGEVVGKDIDVFTEAGGVNKGWHVEHKVKVADKGLLIRLTKTKVGPALKGLEILEVAKVKTAE